MPVAGHPTFDARITTNEAQNQGLGIFCDAGIFLDGGSSTGILVSSMKTTSGADLDELNSNLSSNGIYSLINGVTVSSSTPQNFSTYNSRKVSDYDMLLLTLNYSNDDIRQSLLIPSSIFVSGRSFYLTTNSGSGGTTFNQIAVRFVNDTTISATLNSGVCKVIYAYGIKI